MKERPILFSAPMVRAILEGRKSQTRRVVKPQPDYIVQSEWEPTMFSGHKTDALGRHFFNRSCPHGQPGDRLWVQETWRIGGEMAEADPKEHPKKYLIPHLYYRADCDDGVDRWRPSIHMPRWASRITLEIADIRVERLQEISAEDAMREGAGPAAAKPDACRDLYRTEFRELWDSINGKPKPVRQHGVITHYVSYPWEEGTRTETHRGKPHYIHGNPHVWGIEFKRIKP